MRVAVVGLGVQGHKRRAAAAKECVATVDPVNPEAQHRRIEDVPLASYDAALLCIPDEPKLALLTYLASNRKHALVEKPLFAESSRALEDLKRLAEKNRVACYTAYNHRFEPLLAEMKRQIDQGVIGEVYHGRLFYGNGTVKHVAGTWRDHGLGVIQDLSCHLLDLLAFSGVAGPSTEMTLWTAQRVEANSPDRAVIASTDGRFVLETMYHSWRNSFAFELFGHDGSIHCFGLRKWGGSELIVRTRVFPSGRPEETRQTDEGPDVTWEREVAHFERLCVAGTTDLATDWWIAQTLNRVERQLGETHA